MSRERGSVTIVMMVIVGLVSVLVAGLGGLAQVVAAGDTAQLAADAAALAAAPVTFRQYGAGGPAIEEARRFAQANGARLVACRGCEGDPSWSPRVVEVEVALEVDVIGLGATTISAVAAAEFDPRELLGAVP